MAGSSSPAMAYDQPPTTRGSDLVDLESATDGASAVIFTM